MKERQDIPVQTPGDHADRPAVAYPKENSPTRGDDSAQKSGEITVIPDQNAKHITLRFLYDSRIVAGVKTIPGRRKNPNTKEWTIPYRQDYPEFLKNVFNGDAHFLFLEQEGNKHILTIPLNFWETLQTRRYSPNTIRAYAAHFIAFMKLSKPAPRHVGR